MKALRDYLIVEPIQKDQYVGTIFVGEIDSSLRGKVLQVGRGVEEISEGDTIVYYDGQGLKITEDKKDYVMLRETEISLIL